MKGKLKGEASYFAWNAFLLASIILSKITGVQFPAIVVGIIAGVEIACWIVIIFLIGDKKLREVINKRKMVKGYLVFTEAAMVFAGFYLGFTKIGCAWLMIALLGFTIGIMAKPEKDGE